MKHVILVSMMVLWCFCATGQTKEKLDTLKQATVTASRSVNPLTGVAVDLKAASHLVSPSGEADVIKYVQTIPGVISGAEGSSSYYVRGGNQGNNLVEMDGVRVFGNSHLLGFCSSIPQNILSSADFFTGSLFGEYSNILSSVLALKTTDGNFQRPNVSLSLNNFFGGGGFSVPIIKDRLSFTSSARYSPFGKEYNLLGGVISDFGVDLPKEMNSTVYDVFGKLTWKPDNQTKLSLSYFRTEDDYQLIYKANKWDRLSWRNQIVNFQFCTPLSGMWIWSGNVAFNQFTNNQTQRRVAFASDDWVNVGTNLREIVINGKFDHASSSSFIKSSTGYKISQTTFDPGEDALNCLLADVWYQAIYSDDGRYSLQAMLRGNFFASGIGRDNDVFFNPEGSLSGKWFFSSNAGVSLSADYLVQYFHQIEGMATGWSMDVMAPSNRKNKPESTVQIVGGLFYNDGVNDARIGAYYKDYFNLVYNPDALKFFDRNAMQLLQSGLCSGRGSSKGIEASYSYHGKRLEASLAYTFSHTDRWFPDLCGGKRFLAKYDRPHVLNISSEYYLFTEEETDYGLTGFFTLQSGYLETVRTGYVLSRVPWGSPWTREEMFEYYGELFNNYRMPTYIRLDLGFYARWSTGKTRHALNVGVFNALNRHNPSMIYMDNHQGVWKQLSLFPIMPSLSYKLSFGSR